MAKAQNKNITLKPSAEADGNEPATKPVISIAFLLNLMTWGFSRKNLYRMVNFYGAYSSAEFAEQMASLPFVKSIVSAEMT